MTPVRVLLVDDHPIVRAGVRSLFDHRDDVEVVGEAASGEEALALARHLHPDVVLCDLRLGEGMDGVQTTAALRTQDPAPAVLILTTFDRDAEILGAIEAERRGTCSRMLPPTRSCVRSGRPHPADSCSARSSVSGWCRSCARRGCG